MKFMSKMQKKLANKKEDNRGFSLVELIIVIAIMAILVGIVGTQVLPYINKSKEAKDLQIINSFGTAATTAYSSNAEKVTGNITVTINDDKSQTGVAKTLVDEIKDLTSFTSIQNLQDKMTSKKGKTIDKIVITIDIADTTKTEADGSSTAVTSSKTIKTQAYHGNTKVFDEIVTQL